MSLLSPSKSAKLLPLLINMFWVVISTSTAAEEPSAKAHLPEKQQSTFVQDARNAELSQNIERFLEKHQLPGLVLKVKHRGELIHYQAHGKVNISKEQPMSKDAIFRIYSMSKPITAVAMLQLLDRGLISLNDDIRKYLPEFEPFEIDGKVYSVNVHQLLSHTAGFGYGGGLKNWVDIRYLIANPLSRRNSLDDLVDDLSGIDLKFPPGEKFEYSIASDIQGAIIERVSGLKLDVYFQKYIFQPLTMKDTAFYVTQDNQHRLVDMYEYDAGTFEAAYVFNQEKIFLSERAKDSPYLKKPKLLSSGGGLISSAEDYSHFVSMLANKGEFQGKQLLSKKSIELMLSSHTTGLDTHFMPRVYQGTGFGYGVGIKEIAGDDRAQGSFFWGGMGGTIFWADPENELEVTAMMQVEDGWVALEKWLIKEIYPLIEAP
ncbi:serine hydrolase domain-containing protein [uncultured Pseudoteredinibacter sp.]|uniref:serine hydrolase domain-containing protein n=1 Tax=uncultured Pseudoteredinibacter sp. TaxID=1641701 RepID=UPI0026260AC1|nr:serine hydrolase domain-containing protein [uncultured Pseudoteredinibacter sp.]